MLFKTRKRHISLLEVLISFVIVVLCVLPLISPHVWILKSQRDFVRIIDLDHVVNLLYADILHRLYTNDIKLNELENRTQFPIDQTILKNSGYEGTLPYKGHYEFFIKKSKSSKDGSLTHFLVELTLVFERPGSLNNLEYKYDIFVKRYLPQQSEDGKQQQKKPSKP